MGNIPIALTILLIGLILGIIGLATKKTFVKKGGVKTFIAFLGVLLFVWGLASIGAQTGMWANPPEGLQGVLLSSTVSSNVVYVGGGDTTGDNIIVQGGQNYQPVASYSTVDHFSSTVVTGTSYYKAGSSKAGTTAITDTSPQTDYQYWVSNSTKYYVKPFLFRGDVTKAIVNDKAYANGTLTINGYDLVDNTAIGVTSHNASLEAGTTARIQLTLIGSATKSAMPFGGVFAVEANQSITTISCNGAGISPSSGKYHVTYGVSSTSNRYVLYDVDEGYDVSPDGTSAKAIGNIVCEFTSATNPGATNSYIFTFIPANYYYTNVPGTFELDTEKFLNADPTRTALNEPTATFYWG